MRMQKKWMFILALLMMSLAMSMLTLAATSIDYVTVSVSADISEGDSKSDADNSVSAETDNSRVKVNSVSVTNDSGSGEWKGTDKPKIQVKLKTSSSSYEFKNGFSKDDLDLTDIEYDSYSVKRDGNRSLTVTITMSRLSDSSDSSDDYDLYIGSASFESYDASAYWDDAEDANSYEVRLYKSNGTEVHKATTKDTTYNFANYVSTTGTYYIRVRAVKSSSRKGNWTQSELERIDSSDLDNIREIKTNTPSSSSSESSSSSSGGPSASTNYVSNGVVPYTGTWTQADFTNWQFTTSSGDRLVNIWAYVVNPYATGSQEGADWFRFDANGNMVVGWYQDTDGRWYYLSDISDGTRGKMVTGWRQIGNYYYYFEPSSTGYRGELYVNRMTPDGYRVNHDGVWLE